MNVQLDLFCDTEATAFPTQVSACRVIARVAKRLGYDWCAQCVHCSAFITLTGEWRPAGWVHRRTGSVHCAPHDLRAHQLKRSLLP